MKVWAFIFSFSFIHLAFAQDRSASFGSIDRYAMSVEASSPEQLAAKLTAPYKTNLEKTRVIFSWIAQHISYDYRPGLQNRKGKLLTAHLVNQSIDTSSVLTPVNELVAADVLKKGTALCYGYSRLFKYLCDYANIPCEIINGYGRGDINRIGNNFKTNHSWNAVRIDSAWHLVDVTWASGYFTYTSNEFIKHFDDHYFFTPPELFAQDHFPDNIEWTLLQQPPTPGEFQNSPYKGRCFTKYDIVSFSPQRGIIEAKVGDTIHFQIKSLLPSDRKIAGGSLNDSLPLPVCLSAAYCNPAPGTGDIIGYTYVVESPEIKWLQLVYNDDMILRYRLEVRGKKEN